MRAQTLVLAGRPLARAVSATLFSTSLLLLSCGVASAQAVWPEPTAVASTEAMGVASGAMEYDALGMSAPEGGASVKAPDKPTAGCATECPSICECECYSPCWTVRGGALFLERSRPSNAVLVTEGFSPTSTPVLNAGEFDPGVAWGFEVSAIRHQFLGTCWDLEGRYFGIDGWGAATAPVSSAAGSVVQFSTPLGDTSDPSDVSGSYQSRLQSVELNARRQVRDWLQVLVGLRYMGLGERLDILRDIGPGSNLATTHVRANNDLWGFQLGADARLWSWNRFTVELLGKAGIYGNSATTHMTHVQTAVPDLYFADGQRDNTAFVGEVGLTGCYQLNRFWSLRAGYQLLWIEGVALATGQVAGVNTGTETTAMQTDGSPFYHGGFVGLEFRR